MRCIVGVLAALWSVTSAYSPPIKPRTSVRRRNAIIADGDSDAVSGLSRKLSENSSVVETEAGSRVFDKLVAFPCVFPIKVIGVADVTFTEDVIRIFAAATGVPSQEIKYKIRVTDSLKYISLTVDAAVTSSEMLYELYEKISVDPRVKFKF